MEAGLNGRKPVVAASSGRNTRLRSCCAQPCPVHADQVHAPAPSGPAPSGGMDADMLRELAKLTHDMKNSLAVLSLHGAVLRVDPGIGWDAVDRHVANLRAMIQELFDMAAVGLGALRLDRSRFDLSDAVRRVVGDLMPLAKRCGVEVEQTLDRVLVDADVLRVERVLHNLLLNAIHFSPRGSRIRIGCGASQSAWVRVEDEGRGLAEHEIDQLFLPFRQVQGVGEAPSRGSGIGLFTAKGIVEAHGGTIGAQSQGIGKGATFWIRLPPAPDGPVDEALTR